MANELRAAIDQLENGIDLSADQMRAVISNFLTGEADPAAMRQCLIALAKKGETVDELVGAARAMRDSMVEIPSARRPVLDTCGTGGDGSQTFNISTAAAIVAAAAGVCVAKHGNRKITSATGSADVLAELGINLDADSKCVERCLAELGLCFCFAPRFHPAMRFVAEVRKSIAHPTIFNRLGPLCNPARADCQVLGVGDKGLQEKLASALQQLGTKRSIVVRGDDGVDELSLSGPSRVIEVQGNSMREFVWQPADFGLDIADRGLLFADSPASSAQCIRDVLSGSPGACRDAVVLNAACALWVAGESSHPRECVQLVQAAIDSGAARELVVKLGKLSHEG
ncbi:MAG: anthranilate phosphoribosyltransferase [Pirellulaceae bacterium]|nr:anthranilate phosphoribosyltransferase [Pirellulaceae bacterium]